MFSETETGICFLPLCTPKVRPTNCGKIVDLLDQILITSLGLAEALTVSAFFRRWKSVGYEIELY